MPNNNIWRASLWHSSLAGSDPGEVQSRTSLPVTISGQVPHPQMPTERVFEGRLGLFHVTIVSLEEPFQHKLCRGVAKIL